MNHRIIHIVIAIAAWLSVLAMLWLVALKVVEWDLLRVWCTLSMAAIGAVASGRAANSTILTAPPTPQHFTRDNSAKDWS
jgi:hypothetical protein